MVISLTVSGLRASPRRSCDLLDKDHMTAVMNRDLGYELLPIYDELLLSCDCRQDGHMTSED